MKEFTQDILIPAQDFWVLFNPHPYGNRLYDVESPQTTLLPSPSFIPKGIS